MPPPLTKAAIATPPLRKRARTPVMSKAERLQRRQQHDELIRSLGGYKPRNSTPLQYYNFLREHCIVHNCSIDDGIVQARQAWPKLTKQQRALYDSKQHAFLPIPVPADQLYHAFEMEVHGRCSLGRGPVGDRGATMYTVESYKPARPRRNSKKWQQRSRLGGGDERSAASEGCGGAPCQRSKRRSTTNKRVCLLTPPAQLHQPLTLQALSRILSDDSLGPPKCESRRRSQKLLGKPKCKTKLVGSGAAKRQNTRLLPAKHTPCNTAGSYKKVAVRRGSLQKGNNKKPVAFGQKFIKNVSKSAKVPLKKREKKSQSKTDLSHSSWNLPVKANKGIVQRLIMTHPDFK